ncbi:glycosyl hydrolase 5 family protein-like [Primulina huaijiensis]|uniref:glycosyl hydrolase 5 family protein-like n=1 Tax=Primulina huaijiensis TaxID=1492673 RepID=UPI003CC79419
MQRNLVRLLLLFSYATLHHSLPLSTSSRWIIDEHTGDRVKLVCANWAAHLEPMLAEGLDKQPVGNIVKNVASMGFNCVRLTWATYMFTRYADVTVAQSFSGLGLGDAMVGISRNNPRFLNLTLVDAQRALIAELGLHGVMVVLDNQVSRPMWCCGDDDGNGFFGDKYFDPKEWLRGLAIVAKRYKNTQMVVAMSMRNELRGPLQNETVWYRYVKDGARTIHRANPNLLVIVSGVHYDLDFSFLKKKPLNLNFQQKIVYETHRYSFTEGQTNLWLNGQLNRVCKSVIQELQNKAGFLVEDGNKAPLFVSEFGINQLGGNRADNVFLGCFLGYLAEMDLDWSIWALQGSYYLRDGLHGPEETYGMLNYNWSSVRSPKFQHKLQLVRRHLQDPYSKVPMYYILYHPWSGKCIKAKNSQVYATDCRSFSRWNHAGSRNPIQLTGSKLCLSAAGNGIPAILSGNCTGNQSQWELISDSKLQLASKDEKGTYLCLELNHENSSMVVTNKCLCLDDDSDSSCQENPETQWFKLIFANI